ncbi:MAG TPA: Mut7-C RNAse domain-containing protein [Draconibacterium sp.]|nr:Mut7-C RNAse domain-containing protein [Draconibacterium sp.]
MQNKVPENRIDHSPVLRTSFFRFYEELNEFLPKEKAKKTFPVSFTGKPSVKNTIEMLGVPHTEIDLILVDGTSVDFGYQLEGGEQVSVYPVFESLDISPLIRLRSKPLRNTNFIVDVNLGKLARKLRLLGFDTLFRNDFEDAEIIRIAAKEKRIILTRDKGILKCSEVTHGYWLRNTEPSLQLEEVVERLQLRNSFKPFTRCTHCNHKLRSVGKKEIADRLPSDTLQYYAEFWECEGCKNIYWEGSHFDSILHWIEKLKEM